MSGCVWGSSSGHNFPGYDFCLFVRALQVRGEGIGLQAERGIFPEEGALIAMFSARLQWSGRLQSCFGEAASGVAWLS